MYRVEVASHENAPFTVKSKEHEFLIDTRGKGVTPPDALLASLGGCVGVYVRKYQEGSKIALGDFTIIVEAEFCKDTPLRFSDINVTIDLKGARLDDRRREALLAFVRNCPVHNTLAHHPSVRISFA
jgi:uncharacterized OsmC-like protein